MSLEPPELPDSIKAKIDLARELRSLDYKRSMDWSEPATKAKVVKACLAMANLRDGGTLILGVSEPSSGTFNAEGMSDEHLESFSPDAVAEEVNRYADPPIALNTVKGSYDGLAFVAIEISPFEELPVLCRRDGGPPGAQGFKAGDVFVRPEGKPQTRTVRSSHEMRDLLERAADLQIAKQRRRVPWVSEAEPQETQALDAELGAFR